MSKISTLIRLIKTDKREILVALYNHLAHTGVFDRLDDKKYLKQTYRVRFGHSLNLDNPRTFNEKLNWLKLYDRKPIYTKMVDKYEAKKIVADLIGSEYVVPTIAIYNSVDEISFEQLPKQFAIKCTHDSGSVSICKDSSFNYALAIKKLKKGMHSNQFFWAREWPYKDVKPRIIVENYIESSQEDLVVYKVFCFNKKAELIQVIQGDKHDNETIDYFDLDWNLLDIRQDYPNSKSHLERPAALEEMIRLSEALSPERPFIRVDWYIVDNRPIFSEFTFFSDAGFAKFIPDHWDLDLGMKMTLGGNKG